MRTTLKKLCGIIPMSAKEREAVAMLPAVLVMVVLCLGAAVLLG